MRSMTITKQNLRLLRLNTEQPVNPQAGYTRKDLKHVDALCLLIDEKLGDYGATLDALLTDAENEKSQVRLDGGRPEDVVTALNVINERTNLATAELDRTHGSEEVELILDPDRFDWWKRNWQARDNFNGFEQARRSVFAIDHAFDNPVELEVDTTDGERKLVPTKPSKPDLKVVK